MQLLVRHQNGSSTADTNIFLPVAEEGGTKLLKQGQLLNKLHHYISERTHLFYPVAIETAETWDSLRIELINEVGRQLSAVTNDDR